MKLVRRPKNTPPGRRRRLSLEILESRDVPSTTLASPVLTTDSSEYMDGQILVRWLNGAPPATDMASSQRDLGDGTYLVTLKSGVGIADAVAYYQGLTGVDFAEPDYVIRIQQVPNDRSFNLEWGLNNYGQQAGRVDADIDAPEAWNVTTGNSSVIVGVIDTGIDYNHPDLIPNMWHNPGEIQGDGIDNDKNGIVDDYYGADFVGSTNTGDPMDDESHGTHVAGTIGAVGNNGIGVAGVTWHVQMMALKFLDSSGSGATSDAIEAIDYAVKKGAKILNNSWGGGPFDPALSAAISNARSKGVIFVAAAGNGGADGIGDNIDSSPFFPAGYPQNNVVSVAATNAADNLASFSNFGATSVDLAAPGVSIYSTYPTSMDSVNPYRFKSGTSMATPMVTGALALVWGMHPTWSYSQVINDILSNVDHVPGLSGKVATGGRLNIGNAIANARETRVYAADVNSPIPDQGTTTVAVNIPDHILASDLDVTVDISHSYDADLSIGLLSPSGRYVQLAYRVGKSKDEFINTTFDDQAGTPIDAAQAPFTGAFRPAGSLGVFNGTDLFGTWTLIVTDMAPRDVGTIYRFALTATFFGEATPGLFISSASAQDTAFAADAGGTSGGLTLSASSAGGSTTAAATTTSGDSSGGTITWVNDPPKSPTGTTPESGTTGDGPDQTQTTGPAPSVADGSESFSGMDVIYAGEEDKPQIAGTDDERAELAAMLDALFAVV